MNVIEIANNVFDLEAKAILNLKKTITEDFPKAVKTIFTSNSRLIVSGMGKSGIIGKKIAATLASTGTSSFFLHPGEAYHGDLGMVCEGDIMLLISNSGETDEILKLIPFLEFNKNKIIAMTGNPKSTLALNSNFHLNVFVEEEACPLQLAPTSSTTAALVMGDALAVALMNLRKFKPENFAKFHPGGNLGKKLLTTVDMVMKKDEFPIVDEQSTAIDVVHSITDGRCGLTVVVDQGKIVGIITDGDIRRNMELNKNNFFKQRALDLMIKNPIKIGKKEKIVIAEELMKNHKINSLLVAENNVLVGIIQIYNLERKVKK